MTVDTARVLPYFRFRSTFGFLPRTIAHHTPTDERSPTKGRGRFQKIRRRLHTLQKRQERCSQRGRGMGETRLKSMYDNRFHLKAQGFSEDRRRSKGDEAVNQTIFRRSYSFAAVQEFPSQDHTETLGTA